MVTYSPEAVRLLANKVFRVNSLTQREFLARLGVDSGVIAELWEIIDRPQGASLAHLLWTLHYFKIYGVWEVMADNLGTTKPTLIKWVNKVTRALAGTYPRV